MSECLPASAIPLSYYNEGIISTINLDINRIKLLEYIAGYRDLIDVPKSYTASANPIREYSGVNRGFESDEGSPYRVDKNFYSIAEIQYPIKQFLKDELMYKLISEGIAVNETDALNKINEAPSSKKIINFNSQCNEFIGQIMNTISINSDSYAVTIRVQLGPDIDSPKAKYYLGIVDRSNCFTEKHKPNVLMFTQLK